MTVLCHTITSCFLTACHDGRVKSPLPGLVGGVAALGGAPVCLAGVGAGIRVGAAVGEGVAAVGPGAAAVG